MAKGMNMNLKSWGQQSNLPWLFLSQVILNIHIGGKTLNFKEALIHIFSEIAKVMNKIKDSS